MSFISLLTASSPSLLILSKRFTVLGILMPNLCVLQICHLFGVCGPPGKSRFMVDTTCNGMLSNLHCKCFFHVSKSCFGCCSVLLLSFNSELPSPAAGADCFPFGCINSCTALGSHQSDAQQSHQGLQCDSLPHHIVPLHSLQLHWQYGTRWCYRGI